MSAVLHYVVDFTVECPPKMKYKLECLLKKLPNRGLFFLFAFLDQLSYVEKDEDMGPTLKGENVNCCRSYYAMRQLQSRAKSLDVATFFLRAVERNTTNCLSAKFYPCFSCCMRCLIPSSSNCKEWKM